MSRTFDDINCQIKSKFFSLAFRLLEQDEKWQGNRKTNHQEAKEAVSFYIPSKPSLGKVN